MGIIPKDWMPECDMKRIIVHWTAGGYTATENDKDHYHILVEGDGGIVRGDHSIDDNLSTGDGDYAAHVRGLNTGSIGISACCMFQAQESSFDAGPYPLTEFQWDQLARVAAELCHNYGIEPDQRGVLMHSEVETVYGKAQHGKWDISVLPWKWGMGASNVYDEFRYMVIDEWRKLQKLPVNVSDDDVSSWAVDARQWAIDAGITDGTDPKRAVTREEAWTMFYRYDQYKG